MADYAFKLENPPLLKDHGTRVVILDGTEAVKEKSSTPPTSVEINMLQKMFPNGIPGSLDYTVYSGNNPIKNTVTMTIENHKEWRICESPYRCAEDEDYTRTETFGTSVVQLENLRKTLSVEMGGALKGITAQIKAEVEQTEQTETTWQAETTEQKTVHRKGGRTYVTWQLVDVIKTTTSPFVISVKERGDDDAKPSQIQPWQVNTYECVLLTYQDSAETDKLPT